MNASLYAHHPYMNYHYMYPPYYVYPNMYHPFYKRYEHEQMNGNPYYENHHNHSHNPNELHDFGKQPFVLDIEKATEDNQSFRTTLWTGEYLQVTLMSIDVGDGIGLELHPDVDQFLRIEEGKGLVQMGKTKDNLYIRRYVESDNAIFVPAGMWHNLTNTDNKPLKQYSLYAPPEHPHGTVHRTKAEAIAAEEGFHY